MLSAAVRAPKNRSGVILLVEDLEDDVLLIRRALTKSFIDNPLRVARTGADAIAYLSGDDKYEDRKRFPFPALVLLDLKMPGMDGFEVLEWIRAQPELRSLRVVVLTSSQDLRDVNRAYQIGANSFLVKPIDFENFASLTRMLKDYWLDLDRGPDMAPQIRTAFSGAKAN